MSTPRLIRLDRVESRASHVIAFTLRDVPLAKTSSKPSSTNVSAAASASDNATTPVTASVIIASFRTEEFSLRDGHFRSKWFVQADVLTSSSRTSSSSSATAAAAASAVDAGPFLGLHLHCLTPAGEDHLPPSKLNVDLEFRLYDVIDDADDDDIPGIRGGGGGGGGGGASGVVTKPPFASRSTRNRYVRPGEFQGWSRFCRLPATTTSAAATTRDDDTPTRIRRNSGSFSSTSATMSHGRRRRPCSSSKSGVDLIVECLLKVCGKTEIVPRLGTTYKYYGIDDDSFDFTIVAGVDAGVASADGDDYDAASPDAPSSPVLDGSSTTTSTHRFPVHRSVLASASPVFSAMLSHDMSESRLRQLQLPDVQPAVVRKWIEFMYGGSCHRVAPHARQLLLLADRYDMKELFVYAQEHLVKELDEICRGLKTESEGDASSTSSSSSSSSPSASECLGLLVLAEELKARLLMEECLQRFVEFGGELMSTSEWMEIVETRPNLVSRVVAFLWKAFRDDRRPGTFPPRRCGSCGGGGRGDGGDGGGCAGR